jgi:hypothetical protein
MGLSAAVLAATLGPIACANAGPPESLLLRFFSILGRQLALAFDSEAIPDRGGLVLGRQPVEMQAAFVVTALLEPMEKGPLRRSG